MLHVNETTQVNQNGVVYGPYIWRGNTDRNIIKIDPYTVVLSQYTAPYYGTVFEHRNMGPYTDLF